MEQKAQAQAKPIKTPGPEHPISVERHSSRVVVSVAGRVIADTREALTLHEAGTLKRSVIDRKATSCCASAGLPDRVSGLRQIDK